MRVSIDDGDPGYVAYKAATVQRKVFRVYLDGVEQKWVRTADEEASVVVREKLDENGDFVTENDFFVNETVHGKVVIEAHRLVDPGDRPPPVWPLG